MLVYNPQLEPVEVLSSLTVGTTLVDRLVEMVEDEVGRTFHQHHLLVGPHGIGKTHTLTLLQHRIANTTDLVTVRMRPQESCSAGGFLLRVLEELLEQNLVSNQEEPWLDKMARDGRTSFRSDPAYASSVLATLGKRMGQKIVVLAENMQDILHTGLSQKKSQDHWLLRRQLQFNSSLILVASATHVFDALQRPDCAFYEFFRQHELLPLSLDEMDQLGQRLARRHNFAWQPSPVTLKHLAGRPRLMYLLFDSWRKSDGNVDTALARTFDRLSPLYLPRLDPRILPRSEIMVLNALAKADGPLRFAELVRLCECPVEVNRIHTYTMRLLRKGLLVKFGHGRQARYDVDDPVFRSWRRFRCSSRPTEPCTS